MSKEIVNKIIDSLCDRSGFDDWWYNIDAEIQAEIKDELQTIIETENEETLK
jgi:hypothetical protein